MAERSAVFLLSFFCILGICTATDIDVSCALGTNCVLPCNFKTGSSISIYWKKTQEDSDVHSYHHAHDQLQQQHVDYRNRTSLFPRKEISKGNGSLQLYEVRVQDEGKYLCVTGTYEDSSISTVNLHVFVRSFVVDVVGQGSELECRADGVYPKPEVTWGTELQHTESRTTVEQRDDQLYNIFSSVTLQDNFNVAVCNVSTAHYWRSTQITQEYAVGVFYGDAVLPCPVFKGPPQSLHWNFNYTQRIVTLNGSQQVFNTSWMTFVDALTGSYSLVLKNLTTDQDGFFSCYANVSQQTFISVIFLKTQLIQQFIQISQETAAELVTEIFIGLIIGSFSIHGLARYFTDRGQE